MNWSPVLLICLASSLAADHTANLAQTETEKQETANNSIAITFLANEGFLLHKGDRSVLIDGFLKDPYYGYGALPTDAYRKLVAGQSPFDNIDLALTSHVHLDHFQQAAAVAFLQGSPACRFLSTEQVILKTRHATDDRAVHERLEIVWPAAAQMTTIRHGEITVEAFRLRHSGARHVDIQNLGMIVNLQGTRILHLGDAEVRAQNFEPFELAGKQIDIAIVPVWFTRHKKFMDEHIGAKQYIAAHIPEAELRSTKQRLAKSSPGVFVFDTMMSRHEFPVD